MKVYSDVEVELRMQRYGSEDEDIQHDNCGQIVVYTNMFRWQDGTVRDEPEPNLEDE